MPRSSLASRLMLAILVFALAALLALAAYALLRYTASEIETGAIEVDVGKSRTGHSLAWSHTFRWQDQPVGFALNALGQVAVGVAICAIDAIFVAFGWATLKGLRNEELRKTAVVRAARFVLTAAGPTGLLLFFGLKWLYSAGIVPT